MPGTGHWPQSVRAPQSDFPAGARTLARLQPGNLWPSPTVGTHRAAVARSFETLAPGIDENDLRREFLGLGERLVKDPLAAHR